MRTELPRWLGRLGVAVALAAACSPAARAITDEEIFRNFRFNLINPGARSLALGGAFVSLADDATAAQANPAGLGFLQRWEVFAEYRGIDNIAQSSVRSETLPIGVETFVAVGTDLEDVNSPTFLSGVATFDRWSLGFSRHELLDVQNSTVSGFAFRFPGSPEAFLAEGRGVVDVEIVNLNLSAGLRLGDRWGVGLTVTRSELDTRSEVTNIVLDTGGNIAGSEILEPALDLRTVSDGSDDDWGFAAGLIYKQPGQWQIGAVYRDAPRFSVEESIDVAAAGLDVFGVEAELGATFPGRFSLPDSIGAGASLFLLDDDRLTLAFDVEHIFYSDLLDEYTAGVNILTDFDAEFTIDDETDVRAGAEYLLLSTGSKFPPLALRAGMFYESDSTIHARSTGTRSFATEEVFGAGKDLVHGSVGMGIIFERFKIDVAADFSERDNEYLISFIVQGKP